MKVSDLIERLQDMPADAEVLSTVSFARYHTVDSVFLHSKDNKVTLSGSLWMA